MIAAALAGADIVDVAIDSQHFFLSSFFNKMNLMINQACLALHLSLLWERFVWL